ERSSTDADHGTGQEPALGQPVEGREGHLAGQVAGEAEDDEGIGPRHHTADARRVLRGEESQLRVHPGRLRPLTRADELVEEADLHLPLLRMDLDTVAARPR